MSALIDEWKFITKGRFIVIMLVAPLVIAAIFGYIFKNSTVNESPLAIVDLDHSNYSRQLITKMDASQFIDVLGVYDNYIEADPLLYNEEYSGVLYLPSGLEKAYLQGKSINVGLFIDMTLAASASSIRTGVSEIIGAENAVKGGGASLFLEQRSLYNPTSHTVMNSVMMFVNVIMLVLIGSNTISIVPRLREEGRLLNEWKHPFGIVLRLIPYAIIGTISTYLVIGVLKQVGGLRFEADWLQVLLPFFLYMLSTSLLAMLIGWSAPTAAKAGGRIIALMLPSFLLSGGQVPVALLPEPLQWINKVIPLSYHFKFLRGLGYKGGDLRYFIPELGEYLILISVFSFGILFLFLKEMRQHKISTFSEATPVQTAPERNADTV